MLTLEKNQMFVTECSVGVKKMSSQGAHEFMTMNKKPGNGPSRLPILRKFRSRERTAAALEKDV